MKNITIVVNPRAKFPLEGLLQIKVPAPISPQGLKTPVMGHWFCDSKQNGAPFISESLTGPYYVREYVPIHEFGNRESTWLGFRNLVDPIAFFFDPQGPGRLESPFLLLGRFDLFASRPDDWLAWGSFFSVFVGRGRNDYDCQWKHE